MNKSAKRIVPLTALALVLIAMAPVVTASTLTVNLNPRTGLAKIDSASTTKIVFTYPTGSEAAKYLKNVSSSINLKGSFDNTAAGVQEYQGSLDEADHDISVKNISVSYDYTAKGNATALTINKMTDITAWVYGVFKVENGSVHANLGWRSYVIRGVLPFTLEDHSVDINLVGSTMQDTFASNGVAAGFFLHAFGGWSIWNHPTLNYSALSAPLGTWTKNYNPVTNTTTFSKTISGQYTYTSSLNFNGQKYSLSAVSDPSGQVTVAGYANASGDTLTITSPPFYLSQIFIVGATVVAALVAVGGFLLIRSRMSRTAVSASTALPV
jgi:hypothetical protein